MAFMEKPFIIYRSSAGSGKTYTLAVEYLKLALRSSQAYRSILAVTFTNKATREMKSRIIEFLYALSRDTNPSLQQQLSPVLGLDGPALQQRAGEVLAYLLHGYSYFSVMTIDAFFQKVIRAFARELGLQAGFALELDQNKVLDEVVDALLAELSDDSQQLLQEWLTRFAEEKVEAGKVWDFRRDVKQLARELFKEDYKIRQEARLSDQQAGEDGRVRYQQILSELKAMVARFENALQGYGQQGLALMQQHGLDIGDFAYGKSGVANYFVRMAEKSDFDPKKRSRDAADDPEKWSTKKSPNKDKIAQAVETGLQDALQKAIAHYDREFINYQSAQQLLRFIYAYGILQDISQKLDAYKRENDVMLISDAALFLRSIIGKDDTPFIYEKIGSSFQHYLIDEFQDTSGLQWNNFRPLVENSLDNGQRNLVVGDVKQSIYRWRGGDWQLLLEKIEQDIAPWNTEVRQLDQNYRSLASIIDYNNDLFTQLPRLVQEEISDRLQEHPSEAERQLLLSRSSIIEQAYADARQIMPAQRRENSQWSGYVQVNLLSREETADDEDEKLDWKDQVKMRIPTLVEELQDRGYRLRDIAFLVRDKKAGKEIVDSLMQYKQSGKAKSEYGYEVISSESLFLNASLTVGLLVDILRFLDNPEDALAKGSIAYKYLKLQGKAIASDQLHHIFMTAGMPPEPEGNAAFFKLMPKGFDELFLFLNKLPLYELVENLVRMFRLNEGEELAYLQSFQDAVLLYSSQESGELHTFLKWWSEKGQQTSVQVSEDVDAMRILTIHKSKGLQFKVVLIPFCDWDLDHRPGQDNIIWTEASREPFASFGLMPMRYSSRLAQTVFSVDYYEEMIRAYIDNINLLYVAFTRAEECLYAFAAPRLNKGGKARMTSIANALYTLCAAEEGSPILEGKWDAAANTFTVGEAPVVSKKAVDKDTSTTTERYLSERWRDRISVRPLVKGFFTMDSQGNMHINEALMRRDVLAVLSEAGALQQAMEKIFFERGLSRDDQQRLFQQLADALTLEPLKSWFSAQNNARTGQVLISRQGSQFRPDRILIEGQKATLIQFHENEKHKRGIAQLQGAGSVLVSMGYSVEAYLFDTSRMLVKPLGAIAAEE
jgi:ATP-dependent exoDNAse (exonuclease V) beta subunit